MKPNPDLTRTGQHDGRELAPAFSGESPDPVSETWTFRSSAIAERILMALKARKMMQKELADLIGFRPQQISRILRGNVNLTIKTIAKLEVALGIRLLEVPSGEVHHAGQKRMSRPSRISRQGS